MRFRLAFAAGTLCTMSNSAVAHAAPDTAPPAVTSPVMRRPPSDGQICPLPTAESSERIVFYSTHGGAALSSVAPGDRNREATVADILIERGKQPLYILLSSASSVIWRISGDVNRISKLHVATMQKLPSGAPATGVTGVDRRKITFGDCLRNFKAVDSIAGARTGGELRNTIGREPDVIGADYETKAVVLPTLEKRATPVKQTELPPEFDKMMWRDVLIYWPSGLARVEAHEVVSPERAVDYDVLPSQGGLAQLLGAGYLKKLDGHNEFKILKAIPRFPAGMGGAHSAKFLIGRGVPMPAGDPVHSCVVSEETGEVFSQKVLCGL